MNAITVHSHTLGKQKKINIVRQMAPQRLGIFALITSLILLTRISLQFYNKICIKFASHHLLLYVVYMCQKIIEFYLCIQMLPAKMQVASL